MTQPLLAEVCPTPYNCPRLAGVQMWASLAIHATAQLVAAPSAGVSMRISSAAAPLPQSTRGVVRVVGSDARSHTPATEAAAFWNMYHPHTAFDAANVTCSIVQDWTHVPWAIEGSVVGMARGETACNWDRYFCGTVELEVLASHVHMAFDIFVHEIAHVVVPTGSVVAHAGVRRVIDASHHWNPHEEDEIFGPYVTLRPIARPYTLQAADVANSVACDAQLGGCGRNGTCVAPHGYRNVPGTCVANRGTPAGHRHHVPRHHRRSEADAIFAVCTLAFLLCACAAATAGAGTFRTRVAYSTDIKFG